MARRFTTITVFLMSVILLCLGVPLARGVAQDDIQQVFSDRLQDAAHFASEASEVVSRGDRTALSAELARYDQVYGVTVLVFSVRDHLVLASRPRPAPVPPADRFVVDDLLAGRQPPSPVAWWPWERLPLASGASMLRNGAVIGAVVLLSPTDSMRDRIRAAWSHLAEVDLLALVLVVLLARAMTRWVLRPVRELARTTARINAGDLHARSTVGPGPPELRSLSQSFNEMVRYVQNVIDTERQFVADASHQLRNPLSALLLRIEHLATAPTRTSGPGPDRVSSQQSADLALEAGRSLARTLDTMLALARAERPGAQAGLADVCRTIDERLTSWRFVAEHRGVTVVRSGAAELVARHDPGSLGEAFDAVIDNAIKYSSEGSAIQVRITAEACGPVTVSVIDQGPGVDADELARMTDRFWRSRRDTNVPGSGLGLSIAARLLERHGGRMCVSPNPSGGLRVDLVLAGRGAGITA